MKVCHNNQYARIHLNPTTSSKQSLLQLLPKTIGTSDNLKRFDVVRADLKALKHAKEPLPTHKKEEHDRLVAVLQSTVLQRKAELKEKSGSTN